MELKKKDGRYMRKVKDMPRSQQQAVMSKIKPSMIARGSTKSDIRNIHHDSVSSDHAKDKYNVYRSEMIQHMDKNETKQYSNSKRREKRAVRKAIRREEREKSKQEVSVEKSGGEEEKKIIPPKII